MRFDDEKASGVWITVADGCYFIQLNYPIYYKGKVIAESNGEPIEPGSFLVALFNANFTDAILLPAILDDLLAEQKGTPQGDMPETWKTSTDMQKIWEKILTHNPTLQDKAAGAIQNTINQFKYEPGTSLSDNAVGNVQSISNMGQLTGHGLEDLFNNIVETLVSTMSLDGTVEICSIPIAELFTTQLYDTVKSYGEIDYASFSDGFERIRAYSYMFLKERFMTDMGKELVSQQMPRVSFDFIEEKKAVPAYYLRTVAELFALDAYYYALSKYKYPLCKLCGRYFKKTEKDPRAYCNRPNIYLPDNRYSLTCCEYHEKYPNYKDAVTELKRKAVKAQNKYCMAHQYIDDSYKAYAEWSDELKKREHTARITGKTAPLKQFIENTRFSKIGFSDTDYSKY